MDHLKSGVQDEPGQYDETPSISTKYTKNIPATEAGESFEPGRQRLQGAEITPLHSSLEDKSETLSQK